jgi:hypothetical protein
MDADQQEQEYLMLYSRNNGDDDPQQHITADIEQLVMAEDVKTDISGGMVNSAMRGSAGNTPSSAIIAANAAANATRFAPSYDSAFRPTVAHPMPNPSSNRMMLPPPGMQPANSVSAALAMVAASGFVSSDLNAPLSRSTSSVEAVGPRSRFGSDQSSGAVAPDSFSALLAGGAAAAAAAAAAGGGASGVKTKPLSVRVYICLTACLHNFCFHQRVSKFMVRVFRSDLYSCTVSTTATCGPKVPMTVGEVARVPD